MTFDLAALANWALSSALLVLLVLLLRRTKLAAKLSRTACYALWLPVLLRLLLPVQFIPTPFALDLTRQAETLYTVESTVQTDITVTAPAAPTAQRPAQSTTAPSAPAVSAPDRIAPTAIAAPRPAEIVLTVWGIGAAALAAAIAATNLAFAAKLHRRRVPLADVSAALPVYTVEHLGSPCLVGILRPAIYLSPEDARDARRLRHILAHESSHYRGGDHIWSLLRAAALCLHWYDPLVWYAAALSKRDAELACDERTLRRLGGAERTAYGETLLSLTLAKPRARDLLTCSTAMVGSKTTLRARIEGIAHSRQTRAAAAFAAVAILALALVFAFGKQREATEYDAYLQRVEAAERITYHPPAYSSSYYPALTDPDLVAEARALLLEIEPASERDVPAGELNIFVSSGVSLDTDYHCCFLNVDGVTLVYLQKPDAGGVKDEDFTLIGKYTDFLIASRLSALALGQEMPNTAEPNPLRFLAALQTTDLASAVLTIEKTESTLADAHRDDIFNSLRSIARDALCREVTGEDTLTAYPSYAFSVTFALTDGARVTLWPMSTEKGSVFMSLVSETENRRFVLEDAGSLYSSLLSAAGIGDTQNELCDEIYAAARVSGSETDLEAVARSIGEQIAAAWLAAPAETVWKPTDAKLASVNVFDIYYGENGVGRNFCATIRWKLKFSSRFSTNYWEAGSGLGEPDADSYYSYDREFTFAIRADESWHITGIATGGSSVNCGIGLWNSDASLDCAILVKAFDLTAGNTHDYLIPSRFCDLPASERAKLGAVLDGYTKAQASDFLRAVSDHLAQYPSYHELTAETLYAELPDKYKDFTLILAAEPFWTGEIGSGRFALYDYGKAEWALLYETGDVRELVTTYYRYERPDATITAQTMDDLLGFPGVAVRSELIVGVHRNFDFFAVTDYGVQSVANAFGFYDDPAECTFSVDFDGDGRSELVTNNTYGGDGAERVNVFRWNGAATEVGSPDWSKAGVDISGIGAMRYQESCDTARGTVTVTYTTSGGTKTAALPLTPESFQWTELGELY